MELFGTITQNLRAAVESSRRLKSHPIHRDTLTFWSQLVSEARSLKAREQSVDPELDALIVELEGILAERL